MLPADEEITVKGVEIAGDVPEPEEGVRGFFEHVPAMLVNADDLVAGHGHAPRGILIRA